MHWGLIDKESTSAFAEAVEDGPIAKIYFG